MYYVSYFTDTFINTAYYLSKARGGQSVVYWVAHQVTDTLIPSSTLLFSRFNTVPNILSYTTVLYGLIEFPLLALCT